MRFRCDSDSDEEGVKEDEQLPSKVEPARQFCDAPAASPAASPAEKKREKSCEKANEVPICKYCGKSHGKLIRLASGAYVHKRCIERHYQVKMRRREKVASGKKDQPESRK